MTGAAEALRQALAEATGAPVTLFGWTANPDADVWGIVTVDGQADAVWGDGAMVQQAHEGMVHFFSRSLAGMPEAAVQATLNAQGLKWRLADVMYEDETRLLHVYWTWSAPT